MKYLTAAEYNAHQITQQTRLGTLLARNIVCERTVCERCSGALRFVRSKVQPERIAFYCPACKAFLNLKARSIYKETTMSLLDIVVLAEANFQEKTDADFLRYRSKPLQIEFPTVERVQKRSRGVEDLSRPRFVPQRIEYDGFEEARGKCLEIDQQLQYQRQRARLLQSLKIQSESPFQLAAKRKLVKNPNSALQKYEVRVPKTNQQTERFIAPKLDTPGVGSYCVDKQRPASAIEINRYAKTKPWPDYEFADVPYYVQHAGVPAGGISINLTEQSRKKGSEQAIVAPNQYSPTDFCSHRLARDICFNNYERKRPSRVPLAQQFVGPATYDGYEAARRLLTRENGSATAENSDRWLRAQSVGQLLRGVQD